MTIKMIEKKFESMGIWILENNGLYQLQNMENGNIDEEIFNIESLENKLESLEV